jgi:hypothetical protein
MVHMCARCEVVKAYLSVYKEMVGGWEGICGREGLLSQTIIDTYLQANMHLLSDDQIKNITFTGMHTFYIG